MRVDAKEEQRIESNKPIGCCSKYSRFNERNVQLTKRYYSFIFFVEFAKRDKRGNKDKMIK